MRLQSASNGNVACQECGHGWEAASACRQHRCTQVRGIDMFWSWLFFFRTLTATPSRTFFDNAGWKRWTFKLVIQQSSSLSTHSATGTTMRKFYFQRFWVQPIWSLPRRCPARDSRSEGGALQIAPGAFLGNCFFLKFRHTNINPWQDLLDGRAFRIQRALHCAMLKTVLPKDQWPTYEEDREKGRCDILKLLTLFPFCILQVPDSLPQWSQGREGRKGSLGKLRSQKLPTMVSNFTDFIFAGLFWRRKKSSCGNYS